MILRVVATGRDWGDKRDPVRRTVKVEGATMEIHEFDAWDGPVESGTRGQYFRHTHAKLVGVRDDRWKP